jgi:hypothetical protein
VEQRQALSDKPQAVLVNRNKKTALKDAVFLLRFS